MADKLTFTKMKVRIHAVTADAFKADVLIRESGNNGGAIWAKGVWVPRSNIRSDDDKRVGELTPHQIHNTHVHVADWFRDSRGWKAVEA